MFSSTMGCKLHQARDSRANRLHTNHPEFRCLTSMEISVTSVCSTFTTRDTWFDRTREHEREGKESECWYTQPTIFSSKYEQRVKMTCTLRDKHATRPSSQLFISCVHSSVPSQKIAVDCIYTEQGEMVQGSRARWKAKHNQKAHLVEIA